eukprot:scaffold89045_cov32-Tisochrysis_lutea.AAC.1
MAVKTAMRSPDGSTVAARYRADRPLSTEAESASMKTVSGGPPCWYSRARNWRQSVLSSRYSSSTVTGCVAPGALLALACAAPAREVATISAYVGSVRSPGDGAKSLSSSARSSEEADGSQSIGAAGNPVKHESSVSGGWRLLGSSAMSARSFVCDCCRHGAVSLRCIALSLLSTTRKSPA